MPFAQHHYPFENQELFKEQFPADFISEAVDQTRGWFYSLHAISTLLFDVSAFRNVMVLGLVQDENGQKMSKSKEMPLTRWTFSTVRGRRHPLVFYREFRPLAAEPFLRQSRSGRTEEIPWDTVEYVRIFLSSMRISISSMPRNFS